MSRLPSLPQHRFALIVVLALIVVAAPWSEVWRRQGAELKTAMDARRALEPVALAAQAQRALAAHRPYAAAVLTGRSEQEAERLRRQHTVDTEFGSLVASLEAQQLHRALDETDHLRTEWSSLLEGIGRRQLPAAASNAAHDLMVEQAFVIMDLAAGAGGLHGQVGRSFGAVELEFLLHSIPRYSAALASWGGSARATGSTEAAPPALPAQAQRVARAASKLLARAATDGTAQSPVARSSSSSSPSSPSSPSWEHALLALQQGASRIAPVPSAEDTMRAEAAAAEALVAQVARLDAGLLESIETLQQERALVAAFGILALFVGALAASLALPREPDPGKAGEGGTGSDTERSESPAEADAAITGAESVGPTSDLLQRLRRGDAAVEPGEAADPRSPSRY